jgi:hypothetical protein
LLLSFLAFGCNSSPNQKEAARDCLSKKKTPKTIMAIFTHLDDETTIGPIERSY